MQLTHFNKAKRELTLATNIDEVKEVRDKAEALRMYAKQSGESLEMQNQCAEIKIRAERRGGEILIEQKETGQRHTGHGDQKAELHDATPKLSDLGISKSQSSRWQAIASIQEEIFEAHIVNVKDKKQELTSKGTQRVAKNLQLNNIKEKIKKQSIDNFDRPEIQKANCIDWLKDKEPCDLLLTDPPYMTDVNNIQDFANSWFLKALSKVKSTGRAYIFIGGYPEEINAYLNIAIPKSILIWTYRNTLGPSPKFDYKLNWQAILYFRNKDAPSLNCSLMTEQFTVQDINAPDGRLGDRYHTWQKPDELAERLIRHSTNKGDLVYDCFAGTGTFLLATNKLARIGKGCELDANMLQIAKERGCKIV